MVDAVVNDGQQAATPTGFRFLLSLVSSANQRTERHR